VSYRCPGQAKLVRATQGTILDVAVDIRRWSPTLGKHVMVELSQTNRNQLFIPVGFAHGYVAMSSVVEVQYLCSNFYDSIAESGIKWDDPDFDIKWPSNVSIVSERDKTNPSFKDYLKSL